MAKVFNYTENESCKETWKNSCFKNFFAERKRLFDSYPSPKKGLAFTEPTLKFGCANYSFKTTDIVDKVACSVRGRDFQARYKKDSQRFDVSLRQPLADGIKGFFKYEMRHGGTNIPHYVMGADYCDGKGLLHANIKYNPQTGFLKAAAVRPLDECLKGLRIGCDMKALLPSASVSTTMYNVGVAYNSPVGVTGVNLNDKGYLTLNHFAQIDRRLAVGVELVHATTGKAGQPPNPMAVAGSYQVDGETQIRARVNKLGELSVAIKRDFNKDFNVQMGTVFDVTKPDQMLKPPVFGFKVTGKA